MLDINLIRSNPKFIQDNISRRIKYDISKVDGLLKLDDKWRELKGKSDSLRHERNKLTLEITKLSKEKKDITSLVKKARGIPDEIKNTEEEMDLLRTKINSILFYLPNLLHKSVPNGSDASQNKTLRKVGKISKLKFDLKNHSELVENLGLADFEQGRKVSGQGFNYIQGDLALLDLALQRFGIEFLLKKKFIPVIPPMMLNKETLKGVVDMESFSEVIYKIENEDLHMIGTAEHSLVSMMKDKTITDLPLRVCAVTPCFRKEIGAHGVDTKGLFRMHQFNKVEQVVFCKPEDSFKILEDMQSITESFFKKLGIPFRVIEICSGDLGGKFAKQYDIEAWFPRQKAYKEVTSAGNCTDYQARRLNIKYLNDKKERQFVHILNNTMVATSRAMVAILENYQKKDGTIKVPTVLVSYMNGRKIIGGKQ